MKNRLPDMSVIIVTPDTYSAIRQTIQHLKRQTVMNCLEVLIIAPSRQQLRLVESDMAGFHSYQIIEVGEIRRLAEVKVIALGETKAPVIAFAEDHCFPEPQWADVLLQAHRQDYAAVAPEMCNANPATALSRAGLLLNFGQCVGPTPAREEVSLPWHNTSYKRERLVAYGSRLIPLLAVEGLLLNDLRTQGHKLYLEPAAKTHHVNISLWGPWLQQAFWGGRFFGASRAEQEHWSLGKRLFYSALSPLVPPLRLYRTVHRMQQIDMQGQVLDLLPAIMTNLIIHSIGEIAGYTVGAGRTAEHYTRFETRRSQHVTQSERLLFLP